MSANNHKLNFINFSNSFWYLRICKNIHGWIIREWMIGPRQCHKKMRRETGRCASSTAPLFHSHRWSIYDWKIWNLTNTDYHHPSICIFSSQSLYGNYRQIWSLTQWLIAVSIVDVTVGARTDGKYFRELFSSVSRDMYDSFFTNTEYMERSRMT